MLTDLLPVVPLQPVLVAVTLFDPALDQLMVTVGPLVAPLAVPPPRLQVQLVAPGAQSVPLPVAEKVSPWPTLPVAGPEMVICLGLLLVLPLLMITGRDSLKGSETSAPRCTRTAGK